MYRFSLPLTSNALNISSFLLVQKSNVAKAPTSKTLTSKPKRSQQLSVHGILFVRSAIDPFAELNIQQIIERQSKVDLILRKKTNFDPTILRQAYESCRKICAEHSTSYYLGSLLFTEERRKAIWAVYAWGQRTDELVDGANANLTMSCSSGALDNWEQRLQDIFDGRPHDIVDTALADTVQRFPLDIQLFKYMIKGMRMDTWKSRYESYEELQLYACYVAGTVGLITVPIAGISPEFVGSPQRIYEAAMSLGLADQLTNILRDVVEDSSRGRIYLPQDELKEFGLTDEDIYSRNVTEDWRRFIKKQIMRARYHYNQAEQGASQLDSASRWPIYASIMLYQKILDKIEENNYDNLTKLARVGNAEKLLVLPQAYAKAKGWWLPATDQSSLIDPS